MNVCDKEILCDLFFRKLYLVCVGDGLGLRMFFDFLKDLDFCVGIREYLGL